MKIAFKSGLHFVLNCNFWRLTLFDGRKIQEFCQYEHQLVITSNTKDFFSMEKNNFLTSCTWLQAINICFGLCDWLAAINTKNNYDQLVESRLHWKRLYKLWLVHLSSNLNEHITDRQMGGSNSVLFNFQGTRLYTEKFVKIYGLFLLFFLNKCIYIVLMQKVTSFKII